METDYKIILASQRHDLLKATQLLFEDNIPEFMRHDEISVRYRDYRNAEFSKFHFYIVDTDDNIMASCKSIPSQWDGNINSMPGSYDEAIEKAIDNYKTNAGLNWNTLIGTSVSVADSFRNRGLSSICIKKMKEICFDYNFKYLIIPVRPTFKCKYPLIELSEYINWVDKDGTPFDPWLRVHLKQGGKMIKVADKSMTIKGTIADWEKWTGVTFPASGKYIVDGALSPISIDYDTNVGVYYDPNIWILYEIS